jgi:hypothetical protein
MAAWFVTSPSFDYCFLVAVQILPVPPIRKERCFGLLLTSPSGIMVDGHPQKFLREKIFVKTLDVEMRLSATRVPFGMFLFW